MKIKVIVCAVLLGFSVNVLAVEQPVKENSALEKTEFSAENRQAIKEDLGKFIAFSKLQSEKIEQQEIKLGSLRISTAEDEKKFLQYLITSNSALINQFKQLSLQTLEVNNLRQKFVLSLEKKLISTQRMADLGINKSQTDPKFIELRQEFYHSENDFLQYFRVLSQGINSTHN